MFRTHRVVRRLMVLSVLVFPGVADAQRVPDGWRWQLDKPAPNVTGRDAPSGAWQFQEMVPGMHVTAGPGVILYAPGAGAAGRFMVDADIVLFPNSSESGYGVMFGGRTGAGADTTLRTWNALVLNASGRFCGRAAFGRAGRDGQSLDGAQRDRETGRRAGHESRPRLGRT